MGYLGWYPRQIAVGVWISVKNQAMINESETWFGSIFSKGCSLISMDELIETPLMISVKKSQIGR